MKANQKFRNDRAEVGVGTLIVFIAMVLVAAVAAAVLINTTGSLQQRAQATGKDATQEVSSNLKVLNVYGTRPNGDTGLQNINKFSTYAELSAGALPMDLKQLVIRYQDSSNVFTYKWAAAEDNETDVNGFRKFEITCIRGDCGDADTVMEAGDLVEFVFTLPDDGGADDADFTANVYLAPRTAVQMTLTPETGTPVQADFKSPATYGTASIVTLR